jgi:dihydrofolate reductase
MNVLPKYVASRSLGEADMEWNSELLPPDDALGAVGRLRESGTGDLQVMGSASLARQLVEHDLVDEYRLMIEPVLLGGGKRIFPDDGTMRPLELVSTSTTGTGVHIAIYRPAAGD